MDNLLEQAKTILTDPNFSKLPLAKIKEVFSYFLGKGLTKADLENILNPPKRKEITYLESLPYNVLVNLVLVGNIADKDLIRFCNSSPLLKEQCDRTFNAEGKIIPEYIFYILLQKLGVKLKPGESPKARYMKAMNNRESFLRLKARFEIRFAIEQKLNSDEYITPPLNLYDAFYNFFGLFGKVIINYRGNPIKQDYDLGINLILLLYTIQKLTFNQLLETTNNADELIFGHEMSLLYYSELLKKSPEEVVNMVYPLYGNGLTLPASQIMEDLININEIYLKGIRELFNSSYLYPQGLKIAVTESWENIISVLEREIDISDEDDLTDEIQMLNQIRNLDERDIDYVIYLHTLVLSGELPVLTPFTEEEMIKY